MSEPILNPTKLEIIENIRRSAERGISLAQSKGYIGDSFLDIFQHIIDELERLV